MMELEIRLASEKDIDAVSEIYSEVHTEEEAGRQVIGWSRAIYPTRLTAERSVASGELYVAWYGGEIVASARINRDQDPAYAFVNWKYEADGESVLVLHTLVVSPRFARRGIAGAFVSFYEEMAASLGCTALRIDTNARNKTARAMYGKLGYREAGIVPCTFNGLEKVELVCLEKEVKNR